MNPILKFAITALLVVLISETGKRSSFLGSLLASLPIVSVLSMVWLWRDTRDPVRVARFSMGVFWMVLPSLLLFVLLPPLLTKFELSFPLALALGCAATAAGYFIMVAVLKQFGVSL